MKISVIVPMFNEEKKATKFFKKVVPFLRSNYKDWELVVVDDGSSDRTMEIVKKFAKRNKKIKVYAHSKNIGIGGALRTGLKKAKGDVIITMDSDLTYSPNEIPKLVKSLENEGADMVIGTSFFVKGSDHSEAPPVGSILTIGANLLDRIVFGLNFSTPTCFFRAWRKRLAKNIKIHFDKFESVPESAITAHKLGYKIIEVPVKYHHIKNRKTRQNYIIDTIKHIEMMGRLFMLYRGGKNKSRSSSRN